jgi:uncharacterized protein
MPPSSAAGPPLGPFQTSGVPRAMVGRVEERAAVVRAMVERTPLLVVGPRRHGKTTLLESAAVGALSRGVLVVRVDVESFESLELLAQAILSGVVRGLATDADDATRLLAGRLPELRPEVDVDPHTGSLRVRLAGPPAGKGVRQPGLPAVLAVLDAVDALAEESGRPVVLVLDEVQQLLYEGGPATARELRRRIESHADLGYVLAGSATRELLSLAGSGRLLARAGAPLQLGPLPRDELLDFLQAGFEISGFKVGPGALEVLLDLAQEVPYDVQRLAHSCWEWLRADPARTLDMGAVADGRARLVRQEGPAYTQLWIGLHRAQKVALKAVVVEGGYGLMSREVLDRYRLGVSTMRQALGALEKRGLVRIDSAEGAGGQRRHRLVDPFFATWLRMMQEH